MPRLVDKSEFLNAAAAAGFSPESTMTRAEVKQVCAEAGVTLPRWLLNDDAHRVSRGVYALTAQSAPAPVAAPTAPAPVVEAVSTATAAVEVVSEMAGRVVPAKIPNYVPNGHYGDIKAILESGRFYPAFVTGLSGNGKTTMIEQVCAALNRECYRVNITNLTDEDQLLGSFVLEDGKTVWKDGPVTLAARRGAVLLLDEYDQATAKLMCLQPVLEGKSFMIQRINEIITPAPGFTIVATANTKGQGDDTGRFIGANVMNEATLDRFPVCLEQAYPARATERKIVVGMMKNLGCEDRKFADLLTKWAEMTRELYYESGEGEIITTRRLEHVVGAFAIFGDRMKAVEMATARFDEATKEAFRDSYRALDAEVDTETEAGSEPASATSSQCGSNQRVLLKCSYNDRDQAKALGAKWDPNCAFGNSKGTWVVDSEVYNKDPEAFDHWSPTFEDVKEYLGCPAPF